MQTALSSIWTPIADSNSYVDNFYVNLASWKCSNIDR